MDVDLLEIPASRKAAKRQKGSSKVKKRGRNKPKNSITFIKRQYPKGKQPRI